MRCSLDPVCLVPNYAFCMIYPLFRRRYDRAVIGRTKEVPMKRFIVVAAGVASLLLFGLSSAGAAPAMHFTEDATGDVLDCGDTTYTVVSGEIAIVLHEGTSASGNTNFTGTVTPRNVVLQDAAGNLYSLRGAEWFGATTNANTGGFQATFTGKFQVVSQGSGTVDSVNVVEHISFNGKEISFDFGTCVAP
jgi:hypothetical protein